MIGQAWERWLAWVFWARQGRRSFLRFVTLLAIVGVAVGVAALEVALFLSRGFSREITAKIMGFGAHVQVMRYGEGPLTGADSLLGLLERVDARIRTVAPVISGQAIAQGPKDLDGVLLYGVDPERDASFLRDRIVAGTYLLRRNPEPTVVLSGALARRLGVELGDVLWVYVAHGVPSPFSPPRMARLRIAGLYETGLTEFDEAFVVLHLEQARALLGYPPDTVSRFELTLTDPRQADEVAARIEDRLGFPVAARSIFQIYRSLFAWVELQEGTIPLVVAILVVVAAFNLVGTLLMVVLEKSAHIGVLKTLGATDRAIARIFLFEGALFGAAGILLGNGMALGLGWLERRYALLPLPVEVYYVDRAPVHMVASDFLIVSTLAFALCLLSTYFPARVARRIHPVEALRFL
jgi:lipoprotein-releasing system permease protein|nr:MAG: permease [Bacteroidota bacterium]